MREFKTPTGPDPNRFTTRLNELRLSLQGRDPITLAASTGSTWDPSDGDQGEFNLELWGKPLRLTYPAWELIHISTGKPASPMENTLLLYYFNLADGTPLACKWISFSELPDGKFYNQAFQGYTGKELGQSFGNDLQLYIRAGRKLGGEPIELGDAGFLFWALPRVPVAAVYWQGDEEFPSSAQVLFDQNAAHYLTTDSYAILGSTLTRQLIAAKSWT